MSVPAIVMMIVAILVIWGGLAFALINLSRHPEEADDSEPAAEQATPEQA